ncbi:amyloid beta A4 precursor protein-binding family B member 1-interacting protein-like [Xenentodon cancila]
MAEEGSNDALQGYASAAFIHRSEEMKFAGLQLKTTITDEAMDDIDVIFSRLLGEMDHLSQSRTTDTAGVDAVSQQSALSFGFTDLNESLNELEDHDLDALVADLGTKSTLHRSSIYEKITDDQTAVAAMTQERQLAVAYPRPAAQSPGKTKMKDPQTKADKIKLALEKLKDAKVKKLIVKVLMSDDSSKVLMVDEKQTVRDVLDKLFEKTHCDRNISWSLCEISPELQIERDLEDHEYLVEALSVWTRHSENKLYFISRPEKYVMFTNPQMFYMWNKKTAGYEQMSNQNKALLIKEHFGGGTVIVPDLEGILYLKEDGRKVWKPRFFMLRASGIYYVPKGKTKSSTDLTCFARLERVNIYTSNNYTQKYRAPTSFCFLLKHPRIQKESSYIKFLCCGDEHTLLLWVNAIRIAKYGTVLYENYQAALQRTDNLQTLPSVVQKGPPPPECRNMEEYPFEEPPDFIPPPPPGHV